MPRSLTILGEKMNVKLPLLALLFSTLASPSFGQDPYHYRDRGLALGAIIGGLTGGAIGKNNGNTAAGAAIGVAAGALGGVALGDSMDTDVARNQAMAQQQFARQQYNAQMSRAVRIEDVIAMSQANLSDNVMITHIHSVGVAYRPQPNDLITLSQSGVPDSVIRAMQTAPLATAPPPVPQVVVPRTVYRERVIVEPRYVVPMYPRHCDYPYAYPPPRHYHGHRGGGMHWGVTIGH